MKKSLVAVLALVLAISSGAVMAQTDPDVPGHPRENEVNQRLENQQTRTDNGVQNGQVNAKQEMRDQNRDTRVEHQESVDEAKHNGHLTAKEQTHMNKELNKNSRDIHKQRNPAQKQIMKVPPTQPTPSTPVTQ
jgi:TolA-binding protein